MKTKRTKKQWVLFIAGLIALIIGISIVGFFVVRKAVRIYNKEQLMKHNVTIEISDLNIKAPVLEGTGNDILSKACGHFPGTGQLGDGNYCIAAHSSTLYKEYFNNLKNAENGMKIKLYDVQKHCYTYMVTDLFIVAPDETWILGDFGDDRVTLVTCTDDGTQRRVVVGKYAG